MVVGEFVLLEEALDLGPAHDPVGGRQTVLRVRCVSARVSISSISRVAASVNVCIMSNPMFERLGIANEAEFDKV
mgnify:CR=1 FL=1